MTQPPEIDPTKKLELHVNSVLTVKNSAYALIFAIASISVSFAVRKETFLATWVIPNTPDQFPIFLCRIVLLSVVVALVVLWIGVTIHELNLWIEWLPVGFVKYQVYLAMFGLSLFLGLMFVFINNITVFSGYLSVFLLFNYWTQWLSIEHFKGSLPVRSKRRKEHKPAIEALEHYYLQLPQLGRITTMMFFSMTSFSIALVGTYGNTSHRQFFHTLAYVIIIVNILTGELTIYKWRETRDKAIRKARESTRKVRKPQEAQKTPQPEPQGNSRQKTSK